MNKNTINKVSYSLLLYTIHTKHWFFIVFSLKKENGSFSLFIGGDGRGSKVVEAP